MPTVKPVSIQTLSHPFPGGRVPQSQSLTVQRPSDGPLGVRFKAAPSYVEFSRIDDKSPLHASGIKVGQRLLAIDDQVMSTTKQATDLIRSSVDSSSITMTIGHPCPRHCKLVAAPLSLETPGVVFNSTRDDTMTVVARIFKDGAFAKTSVHIGDIVLAVNGRPVSRATEADAAMRETASSMIVLYVLDMLSVRKHIEHEILSLSTRFQTIQVIRYLDQSVRVGQKSTSQQQVWDKAQDFTAMFNVDRATLLYRDADEYRRMVCETDCNISLDVSRHVCEVPYMETVNPFMEAFNKVLESSLQILEDVVVNHAWKHALARRRNTDEDLSETVSSSVDIPLIECLMGPYP